ncbi:decaprenyl-phosphate phosphoribosyltransferase [bacterium BMS3Abin01]|nr:decaprenyl-phosphate phosphoribosyltransferase [bacterium BMS3Abin01]HDZ59817.1 decaprenyl-phosphate phosphoribosyltransferase [Actinomycetota bacterium]
MIRMILISLRPRQWTKNLVVFAGIIFSGNIFNWPMQFKVWLTFIAFCAVVGAGYLVNDVIDRDKDRVHPVKRTRPIASGRLGAGTALAVALFLVAVFIGGGLLVDPLLSAYLAAYLVLQLAYSLALKRLVIVDVLAISAGFVIRAVAGAAVIHVIISPWLVVCAMLLALFLALAKRRAELVMMEEEAAYHRSNLEQYSIELVDQMTVVTAAATVVSYALYSFTAFDSSAMMITIPFVLYGIFRYLYLVHRHLRGGSPEQVLISDIPMLVDVVLWVVTAVAVLRWTG